ncbi:thiolase family protein [Streptomyces sp. NPDC001292]|uniref:thiolase family protein n=1 Tax=Streptomyces sp. NPDC001292 TaxID=3364558 RepID=UPI0036A8A94F
MYLVDGLRSPIGRFGGALAPLRATEIATPVVTGLLARTGLSASEVEQVIAGLVLQDMTESNPARIVGQRVGVPDAAPAFTLNMQCASGMAALVMAARQVALGSVGCVLAVGMESMSNAPYTVQGARWGLRLGHGRFTDSLEECKLAGSGMWGDPQTMIDVAERHAQVDGVSRREMDEYAVVSHQRAVAAMEAGRFDDETVPVTVPHRGGPVVVARDENPRADVSAERLAAMTPVRAGGTITPGNASAHNDAAAAALVCDAATVARLGLEPIARIVVPGTAMVGCDPHLMGYSCVLAAEAALAGAELSQDDVDLIECNEGFAVQMVACERKAKWPRERLNVDGGSVGLGHPVGMSGLRIVIHLAKALRRRDLRHGLATVPAGSGLGTAVVLERA